MTTSKVSTLVDALGFAGTLEALADYARTRARDLMLGNASEWRIAEQSEPWLETAEALASTAGKVRQA